MAFSRDDNAKTLCKLNEQNKSLGYMSNVPGNGLYPDYFNDPQIRLQKWGANLKSVVNGGPIDIDSDLKGRTRKFLSRFSTHYSNWLRYSLFCRIRRCF